MQYVSPGRTGLTVSRISLGCGGFFGSAPQFFGMGESEREAIAILDAAWDIASRRSAGSPALAQDLAKP